MNTVTIQNVSRSAENNNGRIIVHRLMAVFVLISLAGRCGAARDQVAVARTCTAGTYHVAGWSIESFLTTDMAARITTGTPWPDGSDCPTGSVILVSAEDDPGDTIRPRLDAHNADVRKVHLLSTVRRVGEDGQTYEVLFTLEDVVSLESALKATPDCRLIVVGPVHRSSDIRSEVGGGEDADDHSDHAGVPAASRDWDHRRLSPPGCNEDRGEQRGSAGGSAHWLVRTVFGWNRRRLRRSQEQETTRFDGKKRQLAVKCTNLHKSGRWDSNPRPTAWKARQIDCQKTQKPLVFRALALIIPLSHSIASGSDFSRKNVVFGMKSGSKW